MVYLCCSGGLVVIECVFARPASLRCADNLWILKGWCRKSFEGREAEMESFFKEQGYSGDMDYV